MSTFRSCQGRIRLSGATDVNPSQLLIVCFAETAEQQQIWAGAARSDTSGSFRIAINETYAELPMTIKVFNHSVQVAELSDVDVNSEIEISIDARDFDFLVQNDNVEKFHADHVSVRGSVTLGEQKVTAVPANESAYVVLSRALFGNNEPITASYVDANGDFEIRLPYRLLFARRSGETFTTMPFLIAELKLEGEDIIAASEIFAADEQQMNISINVPIEQKDNFYTEYALVRQRLEELTGLSPAQFDTINAEGQAAGRALLLSSSGLESRLVNSMLQAAAMTERLSVPLPHTYSFARAGFDPYNSSDIADAVTTIITEAIAAHRIGESDRPHTDTVIALSDAANRNEGEKFLSETDTLRDIIYAITESDAVTDIFIRENKTGTEGGTLAFWDSIGNLVGGPQKDKLQRGLQVMAITGIQKEMIVAVLEAAEQAGGTLAEFIAGKKTEDWYAFVETVSGLSDKLCVPDSLKTSGEDQSEEVIIQAYAEKLYEHSYQLFLSEFLKVDVLNREDLAGLNDAGVLRTFLEEHPEYDLRTDNAWEQAEHINSDTLHTDLQTLQNLVRVCSGNVDFVSVLLQHNIRSSAHIAALSEADLIELVSPSGDGPGLMSVSLNGITADAIKQTYQKAVQIDLYIKNIYTQVMPSTLTGMNLVRESSASVWKSQSNPSVTYTYPDLETLFGSMDFCACSECTSMYSPSAYFTDVMNFIRTKVGNAAAFTELDRRRPDLKHIDLSCKNANTLMPYIDLVNETLELQVLKHFRSISDPDLAAVTVVPDSFQTQGSSTELEAYPEHVYKSAGNYVHYEGQYAVYDKKLSKAIYPNSLPFNMARAESNAFLKHFDLSGASLLNTFRPYDFSSNVSGDSINRYTYAAEQLGLNLTAADIVSGSTAHSDWAFYGIASQSALNTDLCNDLELLLQKIAIPYETLLQILVCDYLNPVKTGSTDRRFAIVSKPGFEPDTCALEELMLQCIPAGGENETVLKTRFFKHLHRFVRLIKTTGWTVYQLDVVLASLGLVPVYNTATDQLNKTVLIRIAAARRSGHYFNLPPEKACILWSQISTRSYIDFGKEQVLAPSVYDSFFKNKSILNPLDPNFNDPNAITGSLADNAETICAVLQLDRSELNAIVNNDLAQATTTTVLSDIIRKHYYAAVFGARSFAKLTERLKLTGSSLPAANPAGIDTLLEMMSRFETASDDAFNWAERAYLLTGKDPDLVFTPGNDTITAFLTSLRMQMAEKTGEQDLSAGTPEITVLRGELEALVLKQFLETFNIPEDVSTAMLAPVTNALLSNEFVKGTATIAPGQPIGSLGDTNALYALYRSLAKLKMLAEELVLDHAAVSFFHHPATGLFPATWLSAYDMNTLDAVTAQHFSSYLQWIRARDVSGLSNAQIIELVKATNVNDWVQQFAAYTATDDALMKDLFGNAALPPGSPYVFGVLENKFDPSGAGISNSNAALLLQINELLTIAEKTGMAIKSLYEAILPTAELARARQIRKAAKARYDEVQWLKVVKPVQDTLRTQQRDALVDYILANPYIVGSGHDVLKTGNNLFEHLLIDVEMESCMKTSRLKMAISSAQLFMDRAILMLEKDQSGNSIVLSKGAIDQWQEWRKWYRVWEANRKVFLYPENWIEPELRDKKTRLFRELEAHLLQDEITDLRVEDGYKIYLEGLNEIARLEPVSAYRQTRYGKDILHVFARTDSNPQRYYYRSREDNEWSEWQKMDVDIKSDHVSPVMWNNKLYLFWLTFQKSKGDNTNSGNSGTAGTVGNGKPSMRNGATNAYSGRNWVNTLTDGTNALASGNEDEKNTIWKVTLNWSQLQNGKWQSQELCKDIMELDISKYELNDLDIQSYNTGNARASMDLLSNKGDHRIDELFRNRIYFYPYFPNEADTSSGISFMLLMTGGLKETAIGVHNFWWTGDNSRDPYVNRKFDMGVQLVAPPGTRINKMKMVQDINLLAQGLKVDTSYTYQVVGFYNYSSGAINPNMGLVHYSNGSGQVLRSTPKEYRLTASAMEGTIELFNPLSRAFFFEDENHTFLVEQVADAGATGTPTVGNIATLRNPDRVMPDDAISIARNGFVASNVSMLNATAVNKSVLTMTPPKEVYQFQTFYHAQTPKLIAELNRSGVPGLLTLNNQSQADTIQFVQRYQPTSLVSLSYPQGNTQFKFGDPYSMYNWEIFFHAPMLIAQGLSSNQQFADAQKWFHYIFDPTSNSGSGKQRFWKFRPFFEVSGGAIQTLPQLLQEIRDNGDAVAQVKAWEKDPFNPHRIARMRVLAYMKNVVMKYLDNLIAWADHLFRQDTMESINEATQLYVLAANILGERPRQIPPRTKRADKTFQELSAAGLDALSNAMVAIESFFAPNAAPGVQVYNTVYQSDVPEQRKEDGHIPLQTFYFCLPANDKLFQYWDTIADRLFKIRNCQNIEGLRRQLSLYGSPIDPALLVRARAMGISTASLLNQLYSSKRPLHRFAYMVQKTNEMLGDVKALGGAMLSALEKKDAEALSLLRSTHEYDMLTKIRAVKEQQVEEAAKNLDGLFITKSNTQQRFDYYNSRVFMNANEQKHLDKMQSAMGAQVVQGVLNTVAGVVAGIPQMAITGPSYGGLHFANVLGAAGTAVGIKVAVDNAKASMAAAKGGHERRWDDWQFQKATATKELEQLDQQIFAAQIRLDITRQELRNHELQMEQNLQTDAYMRSKFSNTELYNWMISQLSTTYFQSYQLAFDLACQAEDCFKYELPAGKLPASGFINYGHWDSLKKGLLSGEHLQLDVRRMEKAYLESNERELELTKNVSLALFDPKAILELKQTGNAEITIPEVLFDMDYPGHYMRRIKSVSLSIPCVAGPYTTINCQLQQLSSRYRKAPIVQGTYEDAANYEMLPGNGLIATSAAQNDSGVFELNFRDERYLPFEGTGAISKWNIRFPGSVRQFDLNSINDVIVHIKYTARNDGGLATAAEQNVNDLFATLTQGTGTAEDHSGHVLQHYISVRHDYSANWFDFGKRFEQKDYAKLLIELNQDQLPFFAKGKKVTVKAVQFAIRGKSKLTGNYTVRMTYTANGGHKSRSVLLTENNSHIGIGTLDSTPIVFENNTKLLQITLENSTSEPVNAVDLLQDLFIVLDYVVENEPVSESPNDEPKPELPTQNIVSWWKADSGNNVVDNAQNVSLIFDESGNNRHLQPYSESYDLPKRAITGGRSVLKFLNSNMIEASANRRITENNPVTVLYAGNCSFGQGAGTGGAWGFYLELHRISLRLRPDAGSPYTQTSIPHSECNIRSYTLEPLNNARAIKVYNKNAALIQSATRELGSYIPPSARGVAIGIIASVSYPRDGDVYECLIYDRVLSQTEIEDVMRYLRNKYPFLDPA